MMSQIAVDSIDENILTKREKQSDNLLKDEISVSVSASGYI